LHLAPKALSHPKPGALPQGSNRRANSAESAFQSGQRLEFVPKVKRALQRWRFSWGWRECWTLSQADVEWRVFGA